jgi:hypothetical protein
MFDPLALSYGMGVDSTAVLVGWWRRGIRPHWIGHAQVGNEWPETYAYRPVIDAWLAEVGFPTITDVQYVVQRPKHGHYSTHEQFQSARSRLTIAMHKTSASQFLDATPIVNAEESHASAVQAFHEIIELLRKECSLKWKGQLLDEACADYFTAHVKAGGKVIRAIVYDAGSCDSRRGGVETKEPWRWAYPLREWGWDRDRCVAEIRKAGLPVPLQKFAASLRKTA